MMPTPSPTHLREIARWLSRLLDVTQQTKENPVSASMLDDYATLLAQDLPANAFNASSLHAVAKGTVWFPAYETIRARITEWLEDSRRPPALPGSGPIPGLDDRSLAWVEFYRKRASEGATDDRLLITLSLIRSQSPAAAHYLMTGEARSDDHFNEVRYDELRVEWGKIETVRAAIAELRRNDFAHVNLLRALVGKWAPQNVEMIDAALEHHREQQRAVVRQESV